MRYIRVFSELSNQIRFASQKRVLVELAFIKLTRPEMESSLDSVLERLDKLEKQVEEGVPVMAASQAYAAPPMAPIPAPGEKYVEAKTVTLPKAQIEDLNMVRNEWGKIVRDMGMSIRPSFRETVVEPAGDSCLCIVFGDAMNFGIGSRPSVLGDLERYVEKNYGKSIYFKARLRESGERMDTQYISDEELHEKIHMDIITDDSE
jgi:DNA polymerase-3 subunit gamma/tau